MEETMTPEEYLTGKHDHGIIERPQGGYVAATRTWQGPVRPEWTAAHADLMDKLQERPNP